MDLNQSIRLQQEANTPETTTISKRKPRGKYQKSKTIDLTDYIFDKNQEPTAETKSLPTAVQQINEIKFDKFDKKQQQKRPVDDDRLYLTENNRIRLTQGNYEAPNQENVNKIVSKKVPNQITIQSNQQQQKPAQIVEKAAKESTSSINIIKNKQQTKDDLRYLAENNRIRLTLGKFDEEFIKEPVQAAKPVQAEKFEPLPVETRPKSILKSASNIPEKKIGFDDNVDVISIDSTDTNLSIPSFSTNSSILSPATQNFLKVPNMESSIVKNPSLEYIQNYASVKSDSPLRSSMKKSGSSTRVGRDRSPAPCREIPDLQSTPNIYNNHAVSPPFTFTPDMDDAPKNSNNRNRFIKKKLANRSKSVEVPSVENESFTKSIDSSLYRQQPMKAGGMISKNPFMVQNSNKIDIPTIVISNDHGQKLGTNRPGLTRQNALTKSLGDNLNTVHDRSASYNPRYNRESPRQHSRRHSHHHRNHSHRRRRSQRVSSSLSSSLSSETENSLSRSSSQTSTSSSDFDPRRSTLNIQRMNRSRQNEHEINKMININRTRNSKTEEKQLRHHKHMERVNYSSDDSVCGIPKPSARRLCSGSKPFHKSMDELSYTKNIDTTKQTLPHNEHPYAYKEIELSKNRTLPINPHVLSPPPPPQQSYHQDVLNNQLKNNNNNMNNTTNNFNRNLNQFNEYQKQKQAQKNVFNAYGHVVHPGLKSVTKNLPSYSEMTGAHIDEQVSSVNMNKSKAPTFRGQIIENTMSEKNKINSNFQLNLKNQYLPYQSNSTQPKQNNNVQSNFDNVYDQKRISSLSPSNMDFINDTSNPSPKAQQQQFTQKPLPNYNAYINRNNNKNNNNSSSVYNIEPTPAQKNTRLYHQHQNFLKLSTNNNVVKERSIEAQSHSSAMNKLKFQQNKSKSFDTGPFTSLPSNGIDNNNNNPNNKTSGYSNLYVPSSQNQEQPSTDEMPQSTAIQEKLKRFEQTTTTKSDAKSPFSLSNHHAELSQRESTKLGRALIDENKKTEYPINNRRSPFETNKENSPFTTGTNNNKPAQLSQQQLNMFQASTPTLTTNSQFNQKSTDINKPYLKQPSLFLQNMGYGPNKTGLGGFNDNRHSPSKNAVFNPPQNYKYSQYSTPTSISSSSFSKATSTPPVINNSLTAATAAASEAVAVLSSQSTAKPQNNSLLNKKAVKSDYSIAQMCTSPVYNNDNYEYMSLQTGSKYSDHTEREKSFDSKLTTGSDYNSMESTSQTPSIVSKRAAIFEQKLEQRNLSPQLLEFSRGASFNRSNFSPLNKISKFEDPEMSSGNSSTSYKENKRPISLHDSHLTNHKKVQPTIIDHGKDLVKNDNEPHQMSISDKMKMFSSSQSNSMHNKSLNAESYDIKANKVKRNANRFQTQPVSLTEFEIANDNYVSQINLVKPLVQPQQQQHQQNSSLYKNQNQDSTRDRVLTLNDYRFSGSSLSASSDSTSSPSSLTSSTSSTSNNNDHLIPESIVRKSINNLKLDQQQQQLQHVQPFGTTKQNQLNTVNTTAFTRNSPNKSFSYKPQQRAMTNEIEIITSKTPLNHKTKVQSLIGARKAAQTAAKSKVQIINDRFETNSDLINSNSFGANRKITTMENSMPEADIAELRETKFFKPKSETETFMSLPAEPLKKTNRSSSRDNLSDNENATEMMSIKDRMAALKKNNSVEWRKQRTPPSAATAGEENTHRVSVKQQQMQLKQQLLMATPNSQTPYQMLKNEQKNRDVLAALDNNDESSEEKKLADSNQSLDKEETLEVPKPPKPATKDGRRLMFNAELEKALQLNKNPATTRQKLPSLCGGSDSDHSMLMKNANLLGKSISSRNSNSEKVEMFSTDSEMDSFFKETEAIGKSGSNYRYNDLFSSSCGSPTKIDENDLDDFDKIVTGGQRLTQGSRAKPARKTKSKGNHLKSLQNRTEVSTDYDEQPTSPSQSQPQMNITAELLQKKLNKSSV